MDRQHSSIAVIGIACRFPGARSADEFWINLRDGVESISFFSKEELAAGGTARELLDNPSFVPASGFLPDVDQFDPDFFDCSVREAEIMDPQHRVFLECAWEALENAAYSAETYGGRIACFAGAGMSLYSGVRMNTYFSNHIITNKALLDTLDGPQVIIGNRPEYMPTRVSYKLNLRGPSVHVQTACSTSLVAVHLACQSLLAGECDMALAGASAIHIPVKTGYVYNEGGILSPDGHCRAFDAEAKGTVGGNGCGVVVLKRLSDAQADHDQILAIIRGSAINNDGREKVSYTAPSVSRQADVVSSALRAAGVSADSISYVEAHGTGTALGDPIEVAALTQAFREHTQRTGYCALGSVKTNVGHLDSAAGMAGLIKAILALQNRQIPPSLNYRNPNKNIDFTNSPFFVNTALRDWRAHGEPRRVGVSSLGAGGTNAHVILEEAVAKELVVTEVERPAHILTLSAKTKPALAALAGRYAEHLRKHPEGRLADACFSANVGRTHFRHRLAVVASSRDEMSTQLAAFSARPDTVVIDGSDVVCATAVRSARKPAFLISGQGTQHTGMGAELYAVLRPFREALDRCAELCQPHLGIPLLDLMLREERAEQLNDTTYAQPALFSLSYALAQVWQAWGIEPGILLGHSIGEYVAACLAGVFTLEDAIKLVSARGRLIGALPRSGAMAAVFAEERQVAAELARAGSALAIAAVNGPESVVISGERDGVQRVVQAMQARGVKSRELRVSHAFHSPLMEPMLRDFAQVARSIRFAKPRLPIASTVTGALADVSIATPEYWVEHVRKPVRFADAVALIVGAKYRRFVELGPDATAVGMLENCHPALGDAVMVTSSRRDGALRQLLRSLATLYVDGAPVDWSGFDRDYDRRRVALPTYPFQRRRIWIDPPACSSKHGDTGTSTVTEFLARGNAGPLLARLEAQQTLSNEERRALPHLLEALLRAHRNDLASGQDDRNGSGGGHESCADVHAALASLCAVRWVDRPLGTEQGRGASDAQRAGGTWLVLADRRLGRELAARFSSRGERVLLVFPGASYAAPSTDERTIDPGNAEHYRRLVSELSTEGCRGIVHLWSLDAPLVEGTTDSAALEHAVGLGCSSILALAQALVRAENIAFPPTWLITAHAQAVDGAEVVAAQQAPVWGLVRTIVLELPDWRFTAIDVDAAMDGRALEEEITRGGKDKLVAHRAGRRAVARIEHQPVAESSSPVVTGDATYLVTGGFGALGLEVARWLASRGARHLVLVGRSAPSEHALAAVEELRERAVEVVTVQADVSDRTSVNEVLRGIGSPPLRGVFHLAGTIDDGLLSDQTWERFQRVMAPKVAGAWNLHEATRAQRLDIFMMFSSAASLLGSAGQGSYAAANAFLDALAARRRKMGLPALSVSWGPWARVGMAAQLEQRHPGMHTRHALRAIEPETGVRVLERLLTCEAAHVGVLPIQPDAQARLASTLAELPIDELARVVWAHDVGLARDHADEQRKLQAVAPEKRQRALQEHIQHALVQVVGCEPDAVQDLDRTFLDYGIDSLMALQLRNVLISVLEVRLAATIIFKYPTIRQLAEHLNTVAFGAPSSPAPAAVPAETKQDPSLDELSEDMLAELLARELQTRVDE